MNRLYLFILCVILTPVPEAAAECSAQSGISLQVLGSGGPEMDDGRASSGYLIWQDNRAVILVDAGPGAAFNFEKSGASLVHLKGILFTHFHVDHSVDLPSLVKASYFTARETALPVYGPSGNDLMPAASEFIERLLGDQGAYRYLRGYIGTDSTENYTLKVSDVPLVRGKIQRYQLDEQLRISATPTHHGPLPAIAWRVDIGPCSITFSGDMSNRYSSLASLARGANLLVAHNAIPEGATGAGRSLHMPPSEIGKIAAAAKVDQLVLSHRMNRTLGREKQTQGEIRKYFPGPLVFADDLDRFEPGAAATGDNDGTVRH